MTDAFDLTEYSALSCDIAKKEIDYYKEKDIDFMYMFLGLNLPAFLYFIQKNCHSLEDYKQERLARGFLRYRLFHDTDFFLTGDLPKLPSDFKKIISNDFVRSYEKLLLNLTKM